MVAKMQWIHNIRGCEAGLILDLKFYLGLYRNETQRGDVQGLTASDRWNCSSDEWQRSLEKVMVKLSNYFLLNQSKDVLADQL